MKPRLTPAPLTDEDRRIWYWHRIDGPAHVFWCNLRASTRAADRRDADLMLEQAWRSPGSVVITVDVGDGRLHTHCIVGRKRREEFDRWLETEADPETRRIVYAHRRRGLTQ